MLWGFFKKIVIADRLAIIVNLIYSNPTERTGPLLILATILFAFQIYCDFSGYSDIAIGASRIMGFKLMNNFRRPYFSRSINEFWKRWHISLSSWFKDYLYIPLGGRRVSIPRWYMNIMIVFLVSGLWHGASWTFVIWGGLHGLYLIIEIITKSFKEKLLRITKLIKFPRLIHLSEILLTFILVSIGWIFFRANSISDAFYIIKNIFKGWGSGFSEVKLVAGGMRTLIAFALIGFMGIVHVIQERGSAKQFLNKRPLVLRWAIYLAIMVLIILFGVFNEVQFIYFQF